MRGIKMALWGNSRYNSKWKQKNTQFNYLPKSKISSEVINPISLGILPVKVLLPNAFGEKMWEVSRWHDEKTKQKKLNGSRKILNTITHSTQESQGRSSVQSHLEWNQ